MKINPIGIQSYQQLTKRDNPVNSAPNLKRSETTESTVTITPQTDRLSSRLAIKAPRGSYAEFLTSEERKALELLFRRFSDSSRFGPGYQRETDNAEQPTTVGSIVDMKV